MGTQSTRSEKCDKSPDKEHKWKLDIDDKDFKICEYCDKSRYRTDDEVFEGKL